MLLSAPPVDPDRDQARQWLETELERPGYELQESLIQRLLRWLGDLMPDLNLSGALPPWTTWLILAAVLLAAVALIAFANAGRWRRRQLVHDARPGSVIDEEGLSATDYRTRARAALARGDHELALVDAYRALTASATERTLLDDRPGRTAHEVAIDLAPAFPSAGPALAEAADLFDAVRYGDQHATGDQARGLLALDEQLARTRPSLKDHAR